jgi:predicted nucleic acid-binding protein
MAFVLDASLAASWILPDERSGAAEAVLDLLRATSAYVPSLFWHEARNLLVSAQRQNRIAAEDTFAAIDRLRTLPLEDVWDSSDTGVFSLAIQYRLSAYDAVYLWLALHRSLPLATADIKLAAAARAEKIEILGPLAL